MNLGILKPNLESPQKYLIALTISILITLGPFTLAVMMGEGGKMVTWIIQIIIPIAIFLIFHYHMIKKEENPSFKSGLISGLILGTVFYAIFLYTIIWDQFLYRLF